MYKLASQLAEPYTAILVALALAFVWAWRSQRPRTRPLRVATAAFGLLWLVSMPIVGTAALASLEWAFEPTTETPDAADTLVVLSGDLVMGDETGERVWLGGTSLQRCLHAVELYRRAGRCRMILSGGDLYPDLPGPSLAEAMREFVAQQAGVHRADLVTEDQSRTTYENALYTKPLLAENSGRVFLVTEAVHMRRAAACFRKQGLEVIPAPCDQHVTSWKVALDSFIPSSRGASMLVHAWHEWLGLLWYRLKGRV